MAKAYLKIDVEPGKEKTVKGALLKIKGVSSAELTAGEQDVIVLVEQKSYEDILKLVVNKVRKVPGIVGTVTNLILD
ncbi:TPA: AsnC family transcriptional regulator [bacterium]|nr:AsnC family transcriptional regulator [bacterium]